TNPASTTTTTNPAGSTTTSTPTPTTTSTTLACGANGIPCSSNSECCSGFCPLTGPGNHTCQNAPSTTTTTTSSTTTTTVACCQIVPGCAWVTNAGDCQFTFNNNTTLGTLGPPGSVCDASGACTTTATPGDCCETGSGCIGGVPSLTCTTTGQFGFGGLFFP